MVVCLPPACRYLLQQRFQALQQTAEKVVDDLLKQMYKSAA